MNTSKLNAALDAAARGFRVFPLRRDTKLPWREGWQQAATTDKATITEWWRENPNYNIGIATGNGTLVVDVDIKNGKQGAASLEMLELMGLPESLTVKTASGGKHIYFRIPDHIAGRVDNIEGFPGIDTRGDGNLAVWPGSNIGRNKYELEDDRQPAECPEWFRTILANVPKQVQRQDDIAAQPDQPKNIEKAIHWLETVAPSAIEGDAGDKTTFAVAAELRAFGISEETAFGLMADHWNDQKASPPWSPDQLKTKIANAYNYGQGAFGGKTAEGEFGVLDIDVGEPPSIGSFSDMEIPISGSASKQEQKTGLHFLSYDEMCAMPEPEWLVEGVIQKRTAALMFGKSNAFKSFLAIDIGLSVASKDNWHGNPCDNGKVLFVATEGANGVGRLRVPGWFEHYNTDPDLRQNVYLYPKEICLDVKTDVDALIKSVSAMGGCVLIVLDIFGGTMSGTEVEDTTARAWTRSIQRIMRETGAATLTVAHTGWQDETRARMHTHFWGSFDSRMRVEGDKEKMITMLSVERHKDADSNGSWGFRLEPCERTLVPVFDDSVKPDKGSGLPDKLKLAIRALDEAIEEHGVLKLEKDYPSCRVVALAQWKDKCEQLGLSDSENAATRRQAFKRAKDDLIKRNSIAIFDDFVWSKFDEK
ncbi:bifunctional DNA primase/polymerase [Brucella intermedia]|uniref:bifunctional DNA primase/polymerase n=1 Tax=Brucella intermedia TaxID=94625 RepID=UPI001590EDF5|nr:bifunctional DNA primase/polymerase [Brucella intermedia]